MYRPTGKCEYCNNPTASTLSRLDYCPCECHPEAPISSTEEQP